MRFWSHLRSVHRGAYFVEMKTTTVRKLLPEVWGFLCPVHTPDGGLCGLLNHLAMGCSLQNVVKAIEESDNEYLLKSLREFGLINEQRIFSEKEFVNVIMDGKVLGVV